MNPLEGRSKAVETLMRLCDSEREKTALEAANALMLHTDYDPLEEQMIAEFEELDDED